MNMENINIEKILNKWFEMKYQTYDKLEHGGSIYLYYNGEEYADIRIDKKTKFIYYNWKFYEEFCQIISKQFIHFENIMSEWVEDIFGFKGFIPFRKFVPGDYSLKIPK